jgi:hypothetical protein
MPLSLRRQLLRALAPIALLVTSAVAAGAEACPPVEPASVPRATISNGAVSAVVLLPDAQNGYYRGTRFDWSGVVWCLTYKGHNYFGVWNANSDPRSGNAITGPVEEFYGGDGRTALGYDQAKPGELFVKPGVGVLRRVNEEAYRFNTVYPIVDSGKWTVRPEKRGVTFRHDLATPLGIAYVYEKKLRLEPRNPVLVIEHQMKNTGTVPIDIQVYNHDFFVIDGTRTGPDMTARFPFTPIPDAERPLANGARIEGKQIVYDRELADGQTASTNLTGFSDQASDFRFVVENTKTGVGVEQIGDRPISKIVFWSNPRTVCPEAYVHLTIQPGETGRWSIRYRFFAK